MQVDFEFSVNGAPHRAGGAAVTKSLLGYLRENLLTGVKPACESAACGACSVLLEDCDENGEPALRVANACQLTLPMIAGRSVWTAEGLAEGDRIHPVQQGLARCASYACGYCLPGASAALAEAFESGSCSTVGEVIGQSVGNLCRCTGYNPNRDALIATLRGRARAGGGSATGSGALADAGEDFDGVAPLTYRDREGNSFYRPETLREALRLRQMHPVAEIVAGGTSRAWGWGEEAEPSGSMISLESIPELCEMLREEESWYVGAGVSIAQLVGRLGDEFPTIAEMGVRFGSPQIRNRASVGGNLVAAPHHSDLVPVLLALGTKIRIAGLDGDREIELDEFFTGYRHTALGDGELVRGVAIPRPEPLGSRPEVAFRLQAFYKVSKRRYNDRAIANAAFLVELDGEGVVTTARLSYGGVAAYGARSYSAESLLEGRRWEARAAQEVAVELKTLFPGSSDHRATAEYRNALVAGLWQKFYAERRKLGQVSHSDLPARELLDRPIVPTGT